MFQRKINSFIGFSGIFLFLQTSCADANIKKPDLALPVQSQAVHVSGDQTQIPAQEVERPPSIPEAGNYGLNEIALNPSRYDWHDMDQFYREEMPRHKGMPYYENLQAEFFALLVKAHHFLEKADQASIAFYAEELMAREYFLDYKITQSFFRALSGYWEADKIKAFAKEEYQKNQAFIEQHYADQPEVQAERKETLRTFLQPFM
ncbi:MAG: hypothetical protein AAFR61_01080 [Bacteroidota bacterium]